MGISLRDYQIEAIEKMKNGCILCGGVGSGKSRTSLAYYFLENGGELGENYIPMNDPPLDLYIITTARKRDTKEWEGEMIPFLLGENSIYNNKVIVDSWNNIGKYADVTNAFFIFDEQRVVGYGSWSEAFIKISKSNKWILLSATPGDTWSDYISVFIANGFYRNKTDFSRQHIVYSRFAKFPKIDRYINTGILMKHKNDILVNMDYQRKAVPHHVNVFVDYDKESYDELTKNRWDKEKDKPIENASEFCYAQRKIVNSHSSRLEVIAKLAEEKDKIIIFYNFDYELALLKSIIFDDDVEVAEWNGHRHQLIPDTDRWIYLVQYTAGAEGWNCILTDTIIFYSQNYSYKIMEQSSGRIDRLNTPFKDLYYFHLISKSGIDFAIAKTLKNKKQFNEQKYLSEL